MSKKVRVFLLYIKCKHLTMNGIKYYIKNGMFLFILNSRKVKQVNKMFGLKKKKFNNLLGKANEYIDNKDIQNLEKILPSLYKTMDKLSGRTKLEAIGEYAGILGKAIDLGTELEEAGLTEGEKKERKRRSKKFKEEDERIKALIDANPLYTKWANYFWEHRLDKDEETQKKFIPLSLAWYNEWKQKESAMARSVNETSWRGSGAGLLQFSMDMYQNYAYLCGRVSMDEYQHALLAVYRTLKFPINDIDYKRSYIEERFNAKSWINYESELKKYEEEYDANPTEYPMNMTAEIEKDLCPQARFMVKKWQDYCNSSIYDTDPEHRDERVGALRYLAEAVHAFIENFKDIDEEKNVIVDPFEFTTEYLEFVESNS